MAKKLISLLPWLLLLAPWSANLWGWHWFDPAALRNQKGIEAYRKGDFAAACQAMRDAGAGGRFILSTGDQCGRDTPDENLFELLRAAEEFGVYDPATGRLPKLEGAPT